MSSKSREGGTFPNSFYKAKNTFIQNQTKQVLKNKLWYTPEMKSSEE